jgi:hypothetical protein
VSDSQTPATAPPPGAPQSPPRHGCLTAFMVIVGIIMLLPGLCALIFGIGGISKGVYDTGMMPLIVLGLMAGALGVVMIRAAIRGPS